MGPAGWTGAASDLRSSAGGQSLTPADGHAAMPTATTSPAPALDITPFLRKLSTVVDLREAEKDLLRSLPTASRTFAAGDVILAEGEPNETGFLLQSGWAYRARFLERGERQVVNFLVPGDLSEPGVFVTGCADHTVVALTDVHLATFPHERWFDLLPASTRLTTALWWLASHEEAVLKEHVVSLGRRTPKARLYYLMWELWRRLRLVGLAAEGHYELPVTRETLADVVGLSPRHLSRAMAEAREEGVLDLRRRRVTIRDAEALLRAADCQDTYLQIDAISTKVRRAFERAEEAG